MRRVRKYLYGSPVYPGLSTLSFSQEGLFGASPLKLKTPDLSLYPPLYFSPESIKQREFLNDPFKIHSKNNPTFKQLAVSTGINAATDYLSGMASDKIFGNDTDLGRTMGTLFSSGISSTGNTLANNVLKGEALTQGLGQNAGVSLAGAGVGLASNYIGQGINSLGGNTALSRGIGAGVATGLGTVGGAAASNLITAGKIGNIFKGVNSINPYALAANVVGSALGAATGPSKEYGGKYGSTTQTADTIYDAATIAANAIPGVGQLISAGMVLNKGLSNIFGSTSGMTKTDAILGSAFMGAPVKWLNMAGAKTTGSFNNLSWLNTERTNSFMGNAFGNLGDRFDLAREEAGKTYGTFSRGAYNRAQANLDFANKAWETILKMTRQNEYQNIRSLDMSSINNLRYAQWIQGGYNPIYIGKQGMKILNNATNHNIGMRLLSAAALIDNKQMILSAQGGTKVKVKKYVAKSTGRTWNTREEAIKDNANYKNNIHYRYSIKSGKYKSPLKNYNIPFIPDKKITLTNAGLATGAVLSTNLLDSIAVNAERAGLPIKTAIGLATKESTLNNPTYDITSRAKISKVDRHELNKTRWRQKQIGVVEPIKSIQNIGVGDTEEGLLINYNPNDNPYNSASNYIFGKAKTWEDNIRMLKETEAYADRVAAKNESLPSKSYLQAGFEAYKKNPQGYNPGQANYVQLVDKRANEVWNSPEIQEWYKTYKQSKK